MKNLKYIIIIFIIILLILSIILLVMLKNPENDYEEYISDSANSMPQDTVIEVNEHIEQESDINKIFSLDDYINQMLRYEYMSNVDAVKSIVINYDKIEEMNLKSRETEYYSQEIYKRENIERISYFVKGVIGNTNFEEFLGYVYFKINIDYNNKALSINVIDENTYKNEISNMENTIETFEIEPNGYNRFQQNSFNSSEICQRYMNDFIVKLKYNKDLAFEYIETECKEQRFNNDFTKFEAYIEENKNQIYNMEIENYSKEITEDGIVYDIQDTNGNKYILKVKSGLDYKLELIA